MPSEESFGGMSVCLTFVNLAAPRVSRNAISIKCGCLDEQKIGGMSSAILSLHLSCTAVGNYLLFY